MTNSVPTSLRPLEKLNEILETLNYTSHLFPRTQEEPFDRVAVALDESPEEKEVLDYPLQIFFMEDALQATVPEQDMGQAEYASLQFVLEFPHQCKNLSSERLREALSFILVSNKIIPIGSFGLQNDERQVYYRYTLLATDQNLKGHLIIEAIEIIKMFISMLAPIWTELITTDKPMDEIMASSELLRMFKELHATLN